MNWLKTKKQSSFWSVVFSYSVQQQWTISPLDCDTQRKGFYMQPVMTSSVVGPRSSSKALPKAKLAPQKSHSHCLVVCCPSDPLQLSESWQNHCIWEICSANQWDASKIATPAASISQQKGPNSPQYYPTTCHTTNASKAERIGLPSLASSAIFTWLLANRPRLQASRQLFTGKILPQSTAGRKCFPRVCWIL